jgi:hypothetical protein
LFSITVKWLPEAIGSDVEERKADIWFSSPPISDNSPVCAEPEGEITISSQKSTVEFALFNQIEYNKKQERFMRGGAAGWVNPELVQLLQPPNALGS